MTHVSEALRALGRLLASLAEEIGILLGVGLVAVGFWLTWAPGAFFFSGLVLLWIVMPGRAAFIRSSSGEAETTKRRMGT